MHSQEVPLAVRVRAETVALMGATWKVRIGKGAEPYFLGSQERVRKKSGMVRTAEQKRQQPGIVCLTYSPILDHAVAQLIVTCSSGPYGYDEG